MENKMNILGIDPGLSGGLVVLNTSAMVILDGILMPVHAVKSGKKTRRSVNLQELAAWLEKYSSGHNGIDRAVIENVHAMPGQGVTSMFNFGRALGDVEGLVARTFIPISYAHPATWKKAMGLNRDKGASRRLASLEFTHHSNLFARVKDDGVAEAALMALYEHRRLSK